MIKLTTQQLRAAARVAEGIGQIDDMLNSPDAFAMSGGAQYKLAGQTFFITLEQARATLVERRERLVQDLAQLGVEWAGNHPLSAPSSWWDRPNPIPQPDTEARR